MTVGDYKCCRRAVNNKALLICFGDAKKRNCFDFTSRHFLEISPLADDVNYRAALPESIAASSSEGDKAVYSFYSLIRMLRAFEYERIS